jgi:predicted metal-dependent hydrolase
MKKSIPYDIVESARTTRVSLSVHPDGRVEVRVPIKGITGLFSYGHTHKDIERFVQAKYAWILNTQEKFKKRREHEEKREKISPSISLPKLRRGTKAYEATRREARTITTERLAHFNTLYHFAYGSISIRNQSTRWGSCSAQGNLSFNYRIAQLRPELADYLVVHELCHTKEHNHSDRFWAQVARTIPNYLALRKELRRHRF